MNIIAWLQGGLLALAFGRPPVGISEPGGRETGRAPVLVAREPTLPVSASPLESTKSEEAPAPNADPFPSRTYGNLDDAACLLALEERGVPFERYGHARGVKTPVRLLGALHGVRFIHADLTDWLTSARREVLDCRLVLALDDLADLVAKHGVTTIVHYGVYRGDLPLPQHGRPLHHVAALAIDVAAFEKADGTRLEVKRDWPSGTGGHTCEQPPAAKDDRGGELYGVLCDVAREKIFHQVLTPNHDSKHKDHFHLEVMRDTSWTLLQ